MSKEVFLSCSTCGDTFSIAKSQYNYQTKAGRTDFYCSRTCVGNRKGNHDHLRSIGVPNQFTTTSPRYTALKTRDDLVRSSMKDFIRRFKDRSKHRLQKLGSVGVTLEHMLYVWESQNGKCYFTDVSLTLPRDLEYANTNPNYKASVDRIDNSLGYIDGNIRFVSHTVNNMRGAMDDTSVHEFFEIVNNKMQKSI